MPDFDVVGVGLNATDTVLLVPHFPAYGGKVPFLSETYSPGGQVATAMVACAALGMRVKYIGTIGDDERGLQFLGLLRPDSLHCGAPLAFCVAKLSDKCLKNWKHLMDDCKRSPILSRHVQARVACLKGELSAFLFAVATCDRCCVDRLSKLAYVQPRTGAGKPTLHIECAATPLRA